MPEYQLSEICEKLSLTVAGDGSQGCLISSIAPLDKASKGQISFISSPKYIKKLASSKASAVIVPASLSEAESNAILLVSEDPYLSFAKLTALFDSSPKAEPTIHPTAVISATATLGDNVSVGAYTVIKGGVSIGDGTVIADHVVVDENVTIGKSCKIFPQASIYHHVVMGDHVTIHSNSVIGGDGFGFAPDKKAGGWVKIHQLGSVQIGDHVDIGANTCIDRGALEDTVISDGVIIDNQVQIAHNCIIGKNTAIAGCVGIAGSTIIGENCTLAGGVGVAGHLEIVNNVHVTSMSLVTGTINEPGSYSSGTAMMKTKQWRKSAVRFSQLDSMFKTIKNLKK